MQMGKLPFNLQRPGEDHWSSISIGHSGFHVSMLLTPKNQSIAVEVVVQPARKTSACEQLQVQAEAIHTDLGRRLEWCPMPEKQSVTEAAQQRNIEAGLLMKSPRVAKQLLEHFEALVNQGYLVRL